MKKLSSNIRREINKLAHQRGIVFEQAERERLMLLAEAVQLSDDVFHDVPSMDELHALVDGPG